MLHKTNQGTTTGRGRLHPFKAENHPVPRHETDIKTHHSKIKEAKNFDVKFDVNHHGDLALHVIYNLVQIHDQIDI